MSCPTCRLHLELHQPDPGWPDRLLGTCSGCRGWVVVDLIPGRSPAIGPVPPPPGGDPRPGLAGPLLPDGDDPL